VIRKIFRLLLLIFIGFQALIVIGWIFIRDTKNTSEALVLMIYMLLTLYFEGKYNKLLAEKRKLEEFLNSPPNSEQQNDKR